MSRKIGLYILLAILASKLFAWGQFSSSPQAQDKNKKKSAAYIEAEAKAAEAKILFESLVKKGEELTRKDQEMMSKLEAQKLATFANDVTDAHEKVRTMKSPELLQEILINLEKLNKFTGETLENHEKFMRRGDENMEASLVDEGAALERMVKSKQTLVDDVKVILSGRRWLLEQGAQVKQKVQK